MMNKIIYSKYSNERDDRFKIRTSILEDKLGNRKVEKFALSKESKSHIENIYRYYKLLSKLCENTKLSVNKCYLMENSVEFEYLEGETLEEYLDLLNEKKDYSGIIATIKEYANLINETMGTENFRISKEFEAVFGDVKFPNNLKASKISNIDMIFSNIIMKDKWNIIDYEWTFEFLVPVNYIIYRAVAIYIYDSVKRVELANIGIFKLLGISDEEVQQYQKMGMGFENYVYRKTIGSAKLYNNLRGENYWIKYLLDKEYKDINKYNIQIFYDYGEGFSEENSHIIKKVQEENNNFRFEIEINNDIKSIRIDPSNYSCIVKIIKMVGYNGEFYKIDYKTNGREINNNTTIYLTTDPQIYCENVKYNTSKIIVEIEVQILKETLVIEIDNIRNDLKIQKEIVNDNIKIIEEKEKIIEEEEKIIE